MSKSANHDSVERYLAQMAAIRATGAAVEEVSFYPALAGLLNDLGAGLKPKVHCVLQLANHGAGLPDGGLFTADQCRNAPPGADLMAQMPYRGAIEVKGPAADLSAVIQGEQIARYWEKYRLVLVTNYRDFALVGRGPDGHPAVLERFTLAGSAAEFWAMTVHPRAAADRDGLRFVEYLRRALVHNAPLVAPADVATLLASYARDALARVDQANVGTLDSLRAAMSDALGLRFDGDRGDHFFRSTLVQTLFYGLFAAWVLWCRDRRAAPADPGPMRVREPSSHYGAHPDRFDWRSAEWSLRLPVIRALFEQVAAPSHLGPLGLVEVLDWASAALNRVDQNAFFAEFDEKHAVQYFYEPFLQAFDPELRKALGVWYTPHEIVRYMVARVDRVLRDELGVADGLADPDVLVLDPCCGTGAFLVETLRCIAETLKQKGGDALVAHDLKRAAIERVFGFEILPAPFVVAHLQLGLLLQTLGAPLTESASERAGVYLTNALTGWEPPKEKPEQLVYLPELQAERDAAAHIKQSKKILVVLGNPPYNAFAGTSPEEENDLVGPYKDGLVHDWKIRKFNLDDLYVRFFRVAEKRIAEKTGRGIVCFISNHSWISEPSFVVLRKHLLDSFDRFWIENLHGNRKISEYAPDGRTSETVFAIPGFSAGIQQGVAISLWAKHGGPRSVAAGATTAGTEAGPPRVLVRDDLNAARAVERRDQLLASLDDPAATSHYRPAAPTPANRFSFRPGQAESDYLSWPRLTEMCAEPPGNGLMEKRGGALIDDDRTALETRMKRYFDKSASFETLKTEGHPLTKDAARYDAQAARAKLLAAESYDDASLRRYAIRPFDCGWCYFTPVRPIWNEPRPSLWAQCWEGNSFVLSRFNQAKSPEGSPFSFVRGLSDDHFLAPDAAAFPLRLKVGPDRRAGRGGSGAPGGRALPGFEESAVVANLSPSVRSYLASLGFQGLDDGIESASKVWMHALAVGYSPAYLKENAEGLRQDWPRIPLPAGRAELEASAELGRRVASLLDTETPVPGITSGTIGPAWREVGVLCRADGGQLNPDAGDLDVTAGWGHAGKGGVTMPGRGRLTEHGDSVDVWINDRACWRNVPRAVWDFTIGGYQVVKKWLSYREKPLLGRGLTADEARHVTNTIRRLAALVAMQEELDANYAACRRKTWRDADAPPATPTGKDALLRIVLPRLKARSPYFNYAAVWQERAAAGVEIKEESFRRYLSEADSQGIVFDAGRGWYSGLEKPVELDHRPLRSLVGLLEKRFPSLTFACWSTQQVNPWMHHLLGKFAAFVNVDPNGVADVAEFLRDHGYDAHANPRGAEARKFAVREKTVVVRPLVTEAPVEGHYSPPDALLVDLFMENKTLGIMEPAEFRSMASAMVTSGRVLMGRLLAYTLRRRQSPADLFADPESIIGTYGKNVP